MMRTHRAGDLRPSTSARRSWCAAGSRSRRDHGGVVFLDVRDAAGHRAGRRRPRQAGGDRPRTACATSTSCASRARCGTGPRARSTPTLPTGEVEVAATAARGAQRGRAAAVPARRSHRGRRGAAAAPPLPRPASARRMQRNLRLRARGERGVAPLARRAGLRRGRDADAHRVDPGRRARLRGAVAPVAGRVLRAAAEPAAVQAAADGRAASTATTRSPAACATKTCAPTGSSSSCSSTPR